VVLPGYTDRAMQWMSLGFVALGLFFAYLGVRSLRAANAFDRVALPTDAEITDVRWETRGPAGDSTHVAFAVLRFALRDGRTVETMADFGTNWKPGKVGERVPILYHPDDPTRARIARGFTGAVPRLTGAMLIVFGLLFAIVGTGFFLFFRAFEFAAT
jgi:hypothetical protein